MRRFLFIVFFMIYMIYSFNTFAAIPSSSTNPSYCAVPPFLPGNTPPLVMLVMGKDHKLFYEAYNDAMDIDQDGKIDIYYKHNFDYYGYFDPYKCYKYQNGIFVPSYRSNDKYCNGDAWSGNLLNWLSMSRIDIIRKVLYGGYRSTDTTSKTVLTGTYIPQDAHSWGKELYGNDVAKLTPLGIPNQGTRHLVCVTSKSQGANRKLRVLKNSTKRIWDWASTERPVCDDRLGNPQEFDLRVEVCKSGLLEENCKQYPSGTYKPIGILQKFGEGDNISVCSNNFSNCSSDSDCTIGGKCIKKSDIFFGLLTGSYDKNMSGGVLRKNIGSIANEVDLSTGIFTNTAGIIKTINNLQIVDFNYTDYTYSGGWKTDGPMTEGTFKSWGNPIAEMYYEALRYFADKGSATSAFNVTNTGTDSSLGLPYNLSWNRPFNMFPQCSKPFIIVLSDINTSFDSDQLPGSYFNPSFSGDLTDFNASNIANIIGEYESINGLSWFIGQSGSNFDTICSSKNASNLGSLRGLCPEEPTKQGSYYLSAAAYYGFKDFKNKLSKPNVSSFMVAVSSPVADLQFKVGGKDLRVIPVAKSVSGCLNVKSNCYNRCTKTIDANGLKLSCNPNAFCPTNQIVDYYITNIEYDSDGNLKSATVNINFEDVEQGADHDMDAIAEYRFNVNNGTLKVNVTSIYAAGCIDQVMGFSISGTNEDGLYLVVKDKDASSDLVNMQLSWEKTFTVTGNSAGLLKNPLWYAAKWGNFDDYDKTGIPDKQEKWDKNQDGVPDAYFEAFEGNKLADSLNSILSKILSVSGSGTGVALLTERTSSASVAMQGVFNANRNFDNNTKVDWIGSVYGWWTYAYGTTDNQTIQIREDTVNDHKLNLFNDYILSYRYDNSEGIVRLIIDKTLDSDGNGTGDILMDSSESFDNVSPIWDSGLILLTTSPDKRKIFTHDINMSNFNSTGKVDFVTYTILTPKPFFYSLLGVADTDKDKLINYIRGIDYNGWRKRTVTYKGKTGTWKIGDIIHSKPQLVKYNTNYNNNFDVLFVGANDGMLHAFRVGKTKNINDMETKDIVKLCDNKDTDTCSNDLIGEELWGFIPRNIIPYLKYLKNTNYCHMYFVDLPPYIIDEGDKKILIGGLRLGGGCSCGNNESYCIQGEANGLSSYFAIDISNPENPVPLWEFTNNDLGFSFSGPAYVKRNEGRFIILANGPSDYKGHTSKDLKFFVLTLNSDFTINKTTILDPNISRAFSGKLFTEGIDVNNDGQTDFVLAGYNQTQPSGTNSQGGVVVIHIKNANPSSWDINKTYLNLAQNSITSKIVSGNCFGKPYIFFGSGRHFYPGDNEGTPGNNDENYIWGIPFLCDVNSGCQGTINSAHSITLTDDPCLALQDNVSGSGNSVARTTGWKYPLEIGEGEYLKEKVIIDPIVYKDQVAIIASSKYKTDPCTMESTSKIWMLNCATGRSINTPNVCSGYEVTAKPAGIAVDAAGGLAPLTPQLIDQNTGYYASPVGVVDITVDENLGVGNPVRKGRILFWIEK
ncbi:pilus assembly protein [Calditerrivibrio nitroreducens]|uniref:pilus assembly protein n=1 Tax=Calditerrivibrio nitroreducens TaxID=477976 RepID=UPI003C75B810